MKFAPASHLYVVHLCLCLPFTLIQCVIHDQYEISWFLVCPDGGESSPNTTRLDLRRIYRGDSHENPVNRGNTLARYEIWRT